ncbi:p53 and DNA damage-regulated protein 1-like [Asterias amurensis]|uniref:p53 and DNA damage-regulated protein 1-like n=1 Tax=Asterias amurensis TaxID=7602 RepID=UPI003AB6DC69
MEKDMDLVVRHLGELEALAEEVLSDKQQIVDLDRTRNGNREAIRSLMNKEQQNKSSQSKSWVCFGEMFVKLPGESAKAILKQDQVKLNSEIDRLRKDLKPKVAKLRDMEGRKEAKGFDLTALSKDELKAVDTR